MMWFVYNVLFAIGYLLLVPHFVLRMWRRGGYRQGFLQRFAVYDEETRRTLGERRRIWIHAVSVGEIGVAQRFMDEIRAVRPGSAFVLTTTTSTGHRQAEAKLKPEDVLLYFPLDFPPVVGRVLDLLNPEAIILTESELWPNMIRLARGAGIPVILINGRVSGASFQGYRKIRFFFSRVVRQMNLLLVQAEVDRDRLERLGADPAVLKVTGSAKYDITQIDTRGQDRIKAVIDASGLGGGKPILVGGSTWAGEEAILLDLQEALKADFPDLKLVLVPRHAERRAEVEEVLRSHGAVYVRRSDVEKPGFAPPPGADVLLVDTTGELKNFYAAGTVVFVGKSLTSKGGQNVIEPAILGKAVVVGPQMSNFESVMADLLQARAIVQVGDASALRDAVRELLRDAARREELGRNAQAAVESHRGAVAASVKLIHGLLDRKR